jgi:translation initiation factor IF-2
MSDSSRHRKPRTQAAFSGRRPEPTGLSAWEFQDESDNPGKTVYLLDPMVVKDLAGVLGLKPFQVVADIMELKLFKGPNDMVNFDTASTVARKHGFVPKRPPPGMLVL